MDLSISVGIIFEDQGLAQGLINGPLAPRNAEIFCTLLNNGRTHRTASMNRQAKNSIIYIKFSPFQVTGLSTLLFKTTILLRRSEFTGDGSEHLNTHLLIRDE